MPELPEVETLKRDLRRAVKGQVIASVKITWPKMVAPLSVKKFQAQIKNKKIIEVSRRAKILIIHLSAESFLLIHLKMTGQLIYRPTVDSSGLVVGGHPQAGGLDNLPNKFTHIVFNLVDGGKIFFNDMRKFGWIKLVDAPELERVCQGLGVEPIDGNFKVEQFSEIVNRYPKRKIKQVLLDQKLIAGIGNIYNDEACFCARVLPGRLAGTLTQPEMKLLHSCINKVLKLSIDKKGTSFNTYVHLSGQRGGFVPYLKVYGRAGQKCKRCSEIIQKTKINGRGTAYCAGCQK